jgi:methylglutaconyl-CoA hydratase
MSDAPANGGTDLVFREDRGRIAVLTLNRPDRRNALSRALIAALDEALDRVTVAAGVRAIVLAAAGPVFCAGMDLKEAAELLDGRDAETGRRAVSDMQAVADLIDRIHACPKPIVAAVHGDALAGGAGLATACDVVIMAESARIGYPEVKRGLVAAIVMHDLVRQVGDRRARQLLLSGDLIGADVADQWGLINQVTAPERCLEQAVAVAAGFAEGAPQALATTKQLLDEAAARPANLRGAAAISASVRDGDEAREGIRAFLEKRPPQWAAPG